MGKIFLMQLVLDVLRILKFKQTTATNVNGSVCKDHNNGDDATMRGLHSIRKLQ